MEMERGSSWLRWWAFLSLGGKNETMMAVMFCEVADAEFLLTPYHQLEVAWPYVRMSLYSVLL
jgi:hypothetical protein